MLHEFDTEEKGIFGVKALQDDQFVHGSWSR